MLSVLQFVYSAHAWEAWRFSTSPRNFWKNRANNDTSVAPNYPTSHSHIRSTSTSLTTLIEGMSVKLGLTSPLDWVRVSYKNLGVTTSKRIRRAGGLQHALEVTYPHLPWKDMLRAFRSQGQGVKRAQQRLLRELTTKALPDLGTVDKCDITLIAELIALYRPIRGTHSSWLRSDLGCLCRVCQFSC